MSAITRQHEKKSITADTTSADSTAVDFRGYNSGMLHFPALPDTSQTLTFHVSEERDGTYSPAYDASGNAVTLSIAKSRVMPIPAALAGAHFIKVTAPASVADIVVMLKG